MSDLGSGLARYIVGGMQSRCCSCPGRFSRRKQRFTKRNHEGQEKQELDQKRRQEIAQLLLEERELKNTWNAVQRSASWRVLNKWRHVRNRLGHDRTWLRKLYDVALRPLLGHSSDP